MRLRSGTDYDKRAEKNSISRHDSRYYAPWINQYYLRGSKVRRRNDRPIHGQDHRDS